MSLFVEASDDHGELLLEKETVFGRAEGLTWRRVADYNAAHHRKWTAKNRIRMRAYARDYYRLNRERLLPAVTACVARYRKTPRGREKSRQWSAAWARANPDKRSDQQARYKARMLGAPVVEKIDRLGIAARDGWKCYLCGLVLTRATLTLDHKVPLSKGGEHSVANVAACCGPCNSSKGNRWTP